MSWLTCSLQHTAHALLPVGVACARTELFGVDNVVGLHAILQTDSRHDVPAARVYADDDLVAVAELPGSGFCSTMQGRQQLVRLNELKLATSTMTLLLARIQSSTWRLQACTTSRQATTQGLMTCHVPAKAWHRASAAHAWCNAIETLTHSSPVTPLPKSVCWEFFLPLPLCLARGICPMCKE